MTASQIKGATATPETLFDIAVNLEHIHVEFHRVENMLSVYDERIESDIEFLGGIKDGYVQHFISRYDALRSVMEVMQTNLCAAVNEMRSQIDAIYEADRKARPRPLPTE